MLAQQRTPMTAVRRVRWIALGAAELMSAVGEFNLAHEIGIHPYLAWLLPVALGVYGFCAFATGARADVRAALALMIVCQGLAHLLAVGLIPRHWLLVLAVSAVAPIVCWRVHHLGQHTPTAPSVELAPVVNEPCEAAPVIEPAAVAPSVDEPAPVRVSRSRAEWRTLIESAQSEHPTLNRKQVAAHLGITDRWLRTCLNAA